MHRVAQSKFGSRGNCFAACIASILDVQIDTIPDVASYVDWLEYFNVWLEDVYGLSYVEISIPKDRKPDDILKGYHVIVGDSPRGSCRHAIVGYNGLSYYDPHPANTMVCGDIVYGIFIKLFK